MKKLLTLALLFIISGCLNPETRYELDIYTSVYPIEFATRTLYGHNSNVRSIYPDEVDVEEYTLTEKQIEDYSEADLFIFNGLSKEREYAIPMYRHNNDFRIIDATRTIDFIYHQEEAWLDPANYLKIIKNIKEDLVELIDNHYLQNEIRENHQELRLAVSSLNADLRKLSQDTNKTLVLGDNTFKFLEKYGFSIISLVEDDNLEKNLHEVKELIENNEVSHIYINKFLEKNETIHELLEENENLELIELHSLMTILEDERNNAQNYLTIMQNNIELLKKGLLIDR